MQTQERHKVTLRYGHVPLIHLRQVQYLQQSASIRVCI
uniref:Uncharacterized protein n=1 Tax=Anguilla anguilla TaxID=7936 RepID=A0A0E9VN47_ANGAN